MGLFFKVSGNANVDPLRLSIARQAWLWNRNRLRTTHENTAHAEVSDIWLRYNAWENFDPKNPQAFGNEHDSVNYPAWYALPEAHPIIFGLMHAVRGERLGGVLITRVPPGAQVKPHTDSGWHVEYYDKYYVTLEGGPDRHFWADGPFGRERISPERGDIYFFDNRALHGVENEGAEDRMTLIVCIRSDRYAG